MKIKVTTNIRHFQKNAPIKSSNQLAKKQSQIFFFCSIKITTFGQKKVTKEKFCATKKPIKIWNVNVDNIVISKLIETKTNSKYLIGYLDSAVRPLVLIMPKMSGYVKKLQVKDG